MQNYYQNQIKYIFLEFLTYRKYEHVGYLNDDHLKYRSKKEINYPDHHNYTDNDLGDIINYSKTNNLKIKWNRPCARPLLTVNRFRKDPSSVNWGPTKDGHKNIIL